MRVCGAVAAAMLGLGAGWAGGQTPSAALPPVSAFAPEPAPALHISQPVNLKQPLSVVGPRGALLGQQDGSLEAWIYPWKILSRLQILAQADGASAPIEVNPLAATIDVTPDATVVTYQQASFTIRQVMFAPRATAEGTGAVILYKIEGTRPLTLTLRWKPEMQRMWPAPSTPHPNPEWVAKSGGSGYYVLREASPEAAAAVAMPAAEPGAGDQAGTAELVLRFDPQRDEHTWFPLLMALGETPATASAQGLGRSLAALDAALPALYAANAEYFRDLLAKRTSVTTPDETVNAAFAWATTAMEQLRIRTPGHDSEALTAGFANSLDGVRPGFGWFFGRDSLWSLYAIDSYGDFATARKELEFLLGHQRADGKIMHEYPQTPDTVDWEAMGYEFASADATPLLLMAVNDYLQVSGDTDFVRAHWDGLAQAWAFESAHVSSDGVYNNSQGTGWVESWVPQMPYQEIYLAALDEQASLAFARLAQAAGHENAARAADARAARLGPAIEQGYFLKAQQSYAFSRNEDGTLDPTATIFPAVAWWDGTYRLHDADAMMSRWASAEFSTDWGTRVLSKRVSFYDPAAYHQGTVWPLYTGWVALAEYRAGRGLAGYAHLMQNAELTWSGDLGDVTELLSGQNFAATGTPHQLWSSAMVVTPILRGMFGLAWDAGTRTLTVTPQLPADWNTATVRRVPLGDALVNLTFTRRGRTLMVEATGASGLRLRSRTPGTKIRAAGGHAKLTIPLPAAEVAISQHLPEAGATTRQMKVLDEQSTRRSLTLTLAAPASAEETVVLRENASGLRMKCEGGTLGAAENGLRPVTVRFPAGDEYVTTTVTCVW